MRCESKIEATHRLQDEGRWNVASLFRDQCRRELRSSGASKIEANERAWTMMINEYPPLTADQLDWMPANEFLAMATFPPGCNGLEEAEGEMTLPAAWWAMGHCVARWLRWKAGDFEGAHRIACSMSTDDSRPAAGDLVFGVALADPVGFLTQVADEKLRPLADRLEAANQCEPVVQEIRATIAFIHELRTNPPGGGRA